MRELTYRDALREALTEEMEREPKLLLLGEDIGVYGGAYKVTNGLQARFGEDRVIDSPMSEQAIVGAGLGAALVGTPIMAEVMYIDFALLAMDQLINQAAKVRYMFGGNVDVPLVVRTQGGTGRSSAAQHSQSLERLFFQIPGLRVAIPSTPYDAKGLLKTALRGREPVIFIEHKMLYATKGPVPEETYLLPFGKADTKRSGKDITIVAISRMVNSALQAAAQLAQEGIEAEVLDPRTLNPFDWETVYESVHKTRRLLTVEEGCLTGGIGAEIVARVSERFFGSLLAPASRVAGRDVPIPCSPRLEKMSIPSVQEVATAASRLVRSSAQSA